MGMGAAQDLADQHAGRGRIGAERARPVTLSMPSGRTGRVPTTLNLRVAIGLGIERHGQLSLISAAAACTARTILS